MRGAELEAILLAQRLLGPQIQLPETMRSPEGYPKTGVGDAYDIPNH